MAIKMNISMKVGMALVVSIGLLAVGFGAPGALLAKDSRPYFIDCGNFKSMKKMEEHPLPDGTGHYGIKEWYCVNNSGKRTGDTQVILTVSEDSSRSGYFLTGRYLKGEAHGWWDFFDLKAKDELYGECFFKDGILEKGDSNCPESLISLLPEISPHGQDEDDQGENEDDQGENEKKNNKD